MSKEPGMALVMNSCFTQNGVHLLWIVLPPLRHVTRILESQLDRSKQDIRDFYKYFDAYTLLLLRDLRRLQHSIPSPESEPSANLVLTRLDEVVSEDIRRNYPSTTVSERDHLYFEHVQNVCFLSRVAFTVYLRSSCSGALRSSFQIPLTSIWRGLAEDWNSKSASFI